MRRWMTNDVKLLYQKALKPDPMRSLLSQADISILPARRAIVKLGKQTVQLYCTRIITKASGRIRRHLSKYLVGRDENGTLHEIFLGVVEGSRGMIFRARVVIQQGLLRLFGAGLSIYQKV